VLLAAGIVATVDAAELQGIALSSAGDGAQLVLTLSERVPENVFELRGPDRVVIDLAETQLAARVTGPRGDGIVTAVRLGHHDGVLRVVLQLAGPQPLHANWSQGGRQLTVLLGNPSVPVAALDARAQANIVRAPEELPAAPAVLPAAPAVLPAAPVEPAPTKGIPARHAPPAAGARDIIVAVDAGHGGVDPGAIGHGGTREKDVTLAIATRLAEIIDAEPGMHAVLTRPTDEFVVLRDRTLRARAARADMFVSVHADAAANREAAGASVYCLSEKGASSEAARWLAERENAADLMGGVKLDNKSSTLASVLLDLSQTATISNSITAAQRVLASLDGVGEVRRSQVQQAGFMVLKSPDIPSMLVETAYISNPAEELKLRRPAEQQRIAQAIFQGVRSYFMSAPPEGTRFAARHAASGGGESGEP
jgi:N-acetylmuramoyl-L-alanine amidase